MTTTMAIATLQRGQIIRYPATLARTAARFITRSASVRGR
jgi:hypothetical protein